MNKEIINLYQRVAKALNMPIEAKFDKELHQYNHEYLKLDFNSYYGGYRLDIVEKGTGERFFAGMERRSLKEMRAYLNGLLDGLFRK